MPNIIPIGPITIKLYGLMIALGVCTGLFISTKRAKKIGLSVDLIESLLWVVMLGGFGGSRLIFYITVFPDIIKRPSILWELSYGYVVYGGILGGVLAGICYIKYKKEPVLSYLDLLMPQVALAQAIGRIGCLCAGCCYGKPTHLPIGFTYHTSQFAPIGVALFPTQIISSMGDFVLFLGLFLYSKKRRTKGMTGGLYFVFYSMGRFAIEFLRGDVERGGVLWFSTSQWISIIVFVAALIWIVFLKLHHPKEVIYIKKISPEQVRRDSLMLDNEERL
ncbi:MAG: prolipoprotein diacylglyceryl transferase [Lachnospiraceae bacterium]|nr:prolipoprotein diacylglyceryl transferase [Lachnospiraceae bacterium]